MGRFSTELFERYQRSEKALVGTLAEMYVQGVSTRKVKGSDRSAMRTRLLGLFDQRDQQVARREPEGVCERRLSENYPYLILDAPYEKVREAGVIVSQAVLVAVAVDADGRRQILAVELANRESRSSWREFLSRPSPVFRPSSCARRLRRSGSYSKIPWAKSSPLMRLTCSTRSATSVLRSRQIRRRSSASGVSALTMEHTRGSPRLWANSVRTSVSPSILSVFTRRRRREVKIDAGSTTWLSIPSLSSTRWIQNPSSPASWMTMIGKSLPVRPRAFFLSWPNRLSRPATSPAATVCLDIFSPAPGDRDVITQLDRLSSNEMKIAPRSIRIAACVGRGAAASCIVASGVGEFSNLTLPERRSLSHAHRIFCDRVSFSAGCFVQSPIDRCFVETPLSR